MGLWTAILTLDTPVVGSGTALTTGELRWFYERAQQHYEHDLDLFTNRMSFFLTISVALAGLNLTEMSQKWFREGWLIGSGLGLSVAWLFVGLSAFLWIYRWRLTLHHYSQLVAHGNPQSQTPAALAFNLSGAGMSMAGQRLFRWFRPTVVTLLIPVMFLFYWAVALIISS